MSAKNTQTFRFKSAATPTEAELAAFDKLSHEEKCKVVEAELDKGLQSGVSDKTVDDILKEVKARHRKHAA